MRSSEKESYSNLFIKLGSAPLEITSEDMRLIESFVNEVYTNKVESSPSLSWFFAVKDFH